MEDNGLGNSFNVKEWKKGGSREKGRGRNERASKKGRGDN
jgi:hypothetical protein